MNRTMNWTSTLLLAAALTCGAAEDAHDHAHDKKAPAKAAAHGHDHGGLLEVGDHKALLSAKIDEATGKIELKLLAMDGKTPLKADEAPRINLSKGGKKTQVVTTAVGDDGSSFTATDEQLKGHAHGAIRIVIGGASYLVPLPDDHD